jgi:branched-chain amino acid transport system substrate-binding protein
MFDTYSNSFGLVKPLMEQGLDSFYFITVDYALGHAAQADFTKALEAANLKIVGSVKTPLNAPDLSSPVLVAKASKAKAIIIAAGGPDMVNSVKAAQSFGLAKTGKRIITPYVFLTDIRAMGLETAQGLIFVDAFYWDLDDRTREFAKRFFERHKAMPTFAQAGVYSATRHYLKAVEAVKSIDADLVSAKMRETPVEDAVVKHGKIRPDGRLVHDMYLVEVKSPAESKSDWDVEKVLRVIPGDQAFKPLSESDCPLIKH